MTIFCWSKIKLCYISISDHIFCIVLTQKTINHPCFLSILPLYHSRIGMRTHVSIKRENKNYTESIIDKTRHVYKLFDLITNAIVFN